MNESEHAKTWQDVMQDLFTEWEARRKDGPDTAPQILKKLRNLAEPLPDAEPVREPEPAAAILDAAHQAWKQNPDDPAAMRAFLDKEKPRLLRPVSEWQDAENPKPILWRDNPNDPDDRFPDVVVAVGEAGILSSAGGTGKSYVSLEWARAACTGSGEACGLKVASGPVVIISYEDTPERIAVRLKLTGPIPDNLYVWPDPSPLWQADGERGGKSGRGELWDDLWDQIRRIKPVLLVIDPASSALADVSTSETGPVRSFLRALSLEARRAGCGVLIVAHNSKSTRSSLAQGDLDTALADPTGGSAVWYDGARGVLVLTYDPLAKKNRVVISAKANHGRTGWGARLEERLVNGGFAGLQLATRMDPETVDNWSQEVRKKRGQQRTSQNGQKAQDPRKEKT